MVDGPSPFRKTRESFKKVSDWILSLMSSDKTDRAKEPELDMNTWCENMFKIFNAISRQSKSFQLRISQYLFEWESLSGVFGECSLELALDIWAFVDFGYRTLEIKKEEMVLNCIHIVLSRNDISSVKVLWIFV